MALLVNGRFAIFPTMENIKQWKEVKVGDTVYFADEFAELNKVAVEKVEPEEWDRYLHIYVTGDVFGGETRQFRVVSPSHDMSRSAAHRTGENVLIGRLYTSVEAYKAVWKASLEEDLAKWMKHRANVDERISHIQKDIQTIESLKAES